MTPSSSPPAWSRAESLATWYFDRAFWRNTSVVDAWVCGRFVAIILALLVVHRVGATSIIAVAVLLAESLWYQSGLVVKGGVPVGSFRIIALTLLSYVSAALCFAVFFAAYPDSFRPCVGRFDATYFSFVTIGTIGFGDIVPTTRMLKGAIVAEHLVGLFYLAVLLVVIVGLARKRTESAA